MLKRLLAVVAVLAMGSAGLGDTLRLKDGRVFERFSDSILAVSYRSDGRPSVDELAQMLRRFKGRVTCHASRPSPYALSKNRGTREVLLIGSGHRSSPVR